MVDQTKKVVRIIVAGTIEINLNVKFAPNLGILQTNVSFDMFLPEWINLHQVFLIIISLQYPLINLHQVFHRCQPWLLLLTWTWIVIGILTHEPRIILQITSTTYLLDLSMEEKVRSMQQIVQVCQFFIMVHPLLCPLHLIGHSF